MVEPDDRDPFSQAALVAIVTEIIDRGPIVVDETILKLDGELNRGTADFVDLDPKVAMRPLNPVGEALQLGIWIAHDVNRFLRASRLLCALRPV